MLRGPCPIALLLALGCAGDAAAGATQPAARDAALTSTLIRGVPHTLQQPDFCGEACAEMALRRLGHTVTQEQVFALTAVDPSLGRGAYTAELARALARLGFDVGPVWHEVRAVDATQGLAAQLRALHTDLLRGVPSIVCMRYDEQPQTTEHFRLVLGFDAAKDELFYHEPAAPRGAYRRMSRQRFLGLWPLKYDAARWTVIRLALRPARPVPALPRPTGTGAAALAQRVRAVKQRLHRLPDGAAFTVVVEPPFVVLGDESAAAVRTRARHTVAWATAQLKRAYFAKDPLRVIEVWLFKDATSYERHARQLFGHRPSTPYGYYSAEHQALVMNIATGGGTLVHEIVHPFVEANFPSSPAWLNEGLGSLYEQSGARDGQLVGLTNWRLAGLQRAIRSGALPSFAKLTATTSDQFYGDDPGTNYAQARYLLYYLQERGLLRRYYHRFFAARARDATGLITLAQVLGEKDLRAFQRRWETFVLGLRFP
jgi:hypothetical protein